MSISQETFNYDYNYNYIKKDVKFINLFSDFIKSNSNLDFHINGDFEIDQFTFVFNQLLDDATKLLLDTLVENYIPEKNYSRLIKSQPLNISISSTHSMDYICIANSVYNASLTFMTLSSISIISNIISPDNLGTYQIRIYDSINNNIIWESDKLNNTADKLIEFNDLDNIPIATTMIEIQLKVSKSIYSSSIKAINFNFEQLIQ